MRAQTSMADDQLFDAWQGGDQRAGDQLVARHDRFVRLYLTREVGNQVEDTAQDVWIAITSGRARFEHRCSFRTFLFAVARNHVRVARRRRARDRRCGKLDPEEIPDPCPAASVAIQASEEGRQLEHALSTLPCDLRRLVDEYYFERRTAREIGKRLGVPENTARSRIRRAKALLRHAIFAAGGGRNQASRTGTMPEAAESTNVVRCVTGRRPADTNERAGSNRRIDR